MLFALALIALALPSIASGQATRTWVSGVGDDANPCSRTAPCKTFAGAISKTATKGEINCLDPGGFGGVTITKAITIKCHYTEGGVLVSGTNAIVVNAPTTDAVTLRGLDINGLGTGLNGVRVIQAKSVKVLDSEIYGFTRNGVDANANTGTFLKVGVYNTHIHDNTGNGVFINPGGTGSGKGTVKGSIIEDNACGLVATRFGPDPAFNFATNCGTSTSASGITATARLNVARTLVSDHTTGALSRGTTATVRIVDNEINNNGTGAIAVDSGVFEFIDNFWLGNGTNGLGLANGTIKA
jgi:hypothetical protein